MNSHSKLEKSVNYFYLLFGSFILIVFCFYFLVHVIDDSDANWWKGSNQRGEGLFPANFVSSDLDAEPEIMTRESTKRVQFNEQVTVATLEETASSEAEVEIDEARIDRMLHSLHEADPTGERNDPEELKVLEGL